MRHFDRLLPSVFSLWMLKIVRQVGRIALVTCVCAALTATEAPSANADEQFGEVHFPVSCNAGVQKKFNVALAMLHTFSFPAAAKAFAAVSREDPDCAMAYWGLAATAIEAYTVDGLAPWSYRGKSQSKRPKPLAGRPRVRAITLPLSKCSTGVGQDRLRDALRAYANALEQLQRKYPDDHEAEIFYAYALSALGSPTDQTFTYQLKGAAILEKLLVELPNHPGVIHYLLHTYDNTPYASRGLAAARRLAAVAPSSPHALQFPAHIFVRLGLWQESIDTNRVGAAVDDLFFKPHAMDFLVHSYLQTGQDAAARHVVDQATTMTILPHILDAYASGRDACPLRDRTSALERGGVAHSTAVANLHGTSSRTLKRLWYLPGLLAQQEAIASTPQGRASIACRSCAPS